MQNGSNLGKAAFPAPVWADITHDALFNTIIITVMDYVNVFGLYSGFYLI